MSCIPHRRLVQTGLGTMGFTTRLRSGRVRSGASATGRPGSLPPPGTLSGFALGHSQGFFEHELTAVQFPTVLTDGMLSSSGHSLYLAKATDLDQLLARLEAVRMEVASLCSR